MPRLVRRVAVRDVDRGALGSAASVACRAVEARVVPKHARRPEDGGGAAHSEVRVGVQHQRAALEGEVAADSDVARKLLYEARLAVDDAHAVNAAAPL